MVKKILGSVIIITVVAIGAVGATRAFFSDTETSSNNIFRAGAIDLLIDNTSYYNGLASPLTTWGLSDLTHQLFFNFLDLKPGDYGEDTISLHVDDNDAWACMNVNLTKNIDNTCTEPELLDDPTCTAGEEASQSGELAQNINFIFWGDDGDNVLESDEEVFKEGTAQTLFNGVSWAIADSNGSLWSEGPDPLIGGETYFVGKAWCFGDLTQAPLPQDGHGNVINPSLDNNDNTTAGEPADGGYLCDGSGLNNETQTDIVLADVAFSAIQSRNNPDFVCGDDTPGEEPCIDEADVMLVLDRSGSISPSELTTLKTAANDFVDALSLNGTHAGVASFATSASLDHHLSSDATSVKAAINALTTGGFTNLYQALQIADDEMDNPGDSHDRPDATSPDFMIVITDGNPNRPLPAETADDLAAAEAALSRAEGTTIYVVGVGNDVDATFLQNQIASSPAHYFSADDYTDLSAILQQIAECENE